MRSEVEVRNELLSWANQLEDIRAMWLTGSRADSSRTPDALSDYDAGLLVRNTIPFLEDASWVERFGTVMVRWPRRPGPTYSEDWVTQLVLYTDGVRIDFQLTDRTLDLDGLRHEGYRLLLDKDGVFGAGGQESEPSYEISPPNEEGFVSTMNDFWWDIVYVPKALLRGELNFAKFMLDGGLRFSVLQPLIEWYVGSTAGWKVDTGIHGRWFHRYLPAHLWQAYEATFSGAGLEENWTALFAAMDFVRELGREVASRLSLAYPEETDERVSEYIGLLYRAARGVDG